MNMKKSQVKKVFLNFIIVLVTCTLLGYLSHDLMNGVKIGLGVGTGVAIGTAMFDGLHKSN
jgi:hypothetical protein